MDFDPTVVIDEAQLAEFTHERTHPWYVCPVLSAAAPSDRNQLTSQEFGNLVMSAVPAANPAIAVAVVDRFGNRLGIFKHRAVG